MWKLPVTHSFWATSSFNFPFFKVSDLKRGTSPRDKGKSPHEFDREVP